MKFTDFHRSVQLRIALAFGTNLVSNLALPYMPIYFSDRLGSTAAGLATILSIIVGIASGIVGGYYADRIGRKKLVLGAEAVWAFSCLMMALANSPWWSSPAVTFAMMLAISLCWGVHGPAVDGMMLDMTKPEERKFMYGFMYWANNLSMAFAGIVGAYLFKDHLFGLFLAQTIVVLVSFFVMLVFIQDLYKPKEAAAQKPHHGSDRASPRGQMWANYRMVLKDTTFIIYIIASMLVISVEFHMSNYIGVRLEHDVKDAVLLQWRAWSYRIDGIELLGVLRSENTVLVVLLSFVVRTIIKRYEEKPLLFCGFLFYIIGYGLIAYSDKPWLLMASMLVATFGELVYVPVKQAYLGYIVPDHARASYMALNGLTFRGAFLIGGAGIILGGWLPVRAMAALIFMTGIVGLVLFAVILPRMDVTRDAMISGSGGAGKGTSAQLSM